MKPWIAPTCLALALAAGVAWQHPATAAGAPVDHLWRAPEAGLLHLVDGLDNDGQPRTCLGSQRANGTWTHDCGFGPEDNSRHGIDEGDIARKLRGAGYRQVIEIGRDGGRFRARAIDPDGDHVIVFFDAGTGEFIRKKND